MFWITNKDYQEDIVALPKDEYSSYKAGEGLFIDPEDGIAYPLPHTPDPESAEAFYAPQYISAVTLSAGSTEELLAYKVTQEAEIKVLCIFTDGVPNVGDEICAVDSQTCVSGLSDVTAKGHIIIEDLNGCDEKSTFTYMGNTAFGGEITVRIFPTPSIDIEEGGITPTGTISITANGNDIDVTEYASANVNVPASAVVSGKRSITNNGDNIDVTNYQYVKVNVPASAVTSGTKTITANGTGIDVTNYALVDVNVDSNIIYKEISITNNTGETFMLEGAPIIDIATGQKSAPSIQKNATRTVYVLGRTTDGIWSTFSARLNFYNSTSSPANLVGTASGSSGGVTVYSGGSGKVKYSIYVVTDGTVTISNS